jgi:uncharacterized protein YggE
MNNSRNLNASASVRTVVTAVALIYSSAAFGQQTAPAPRTSITATGEATVSANPDQATVSFAITTTAMAATDASSQNAMQTSSVIAALRAVMGSSDTLSTISYYLNPNYNNNGVLTGYTATNTIQVTTGDLTSPGKLIDTAVQSGATRVQSLSFGLKNSQPLRAQALQQAAAVAQTQVAAIAAGLGVKLGSVIAASDGSSVTPVVGPIAGGSAASTPIVTGAVQVTADVRLQVAIAQ